MSRVNLLLLITAGAALATNPNEKSFRDYLHQQQRKAGTDWLTSTIASRILSLVIDIKDYKFFTIVTVPEHQAFFIGIFGTWLAIPKQFRFQ